MSAAFKWWALGALVVPLGVTRPSVVAAAEPRIQSVAATPDARPWGPFQEIGIPLAPQPSGGAITRTVPPGVTLLIRLWTRPPASVFRVEAREARRAPTYHEIAAAPPTLKVPKAVAPECGPTQEALESLLGSRSVAEAERAEQALGAAGRRVLCREMATVANEVFGRSRPRIPGQWQLGPGEELQLNIQELASGGGVSATWNVTLTAAVATPAPASEWPYANEQEWLAAAVVSDLHRLLSLASGAKSDPKPATVRLLGKTPDGNVIVKVDVSLPAKPPVSRDVILEPSVFAPEVYQSFARDLAKSLAVQSGKPEESEGLLGRLADLRAETLRRESDRIGAWLTRRPLDPRGNEEAALVHLALALRETAGAFTDIRPSLARATAHLAVADLAGGTPGAPGRTARAALLVLCGRQVEVLPSLKAWLASPSTPASERAWARALTLRVTGDWRLAPGGERLTLLERLELFRARRASLDDLLAMEMFGEHEPDAVPDWSWIALRGPFSVQTGNTFVGHAFPATLAELASTVLGKELPSTRPEEVASLLRPGVSSSAVAWSEGKASAHVLDRATWAAFFARQLASAADSADDHLRAALGKPDDADALAAQVGPYLKDTPWAIALEPLRRRRVGEARPPDCGAFVTWVQRHPEAIPARSWNGFTDTCGESRMGGIPPMERWFSGPAVPGTVVGLAERTETRAMVGFGPVIDQLRRLAPYDEAVARVAVVYGGKQGDPKAVADAYGARKDYSIPALRRLAEAEMGQPDRRRPLLERLCELSVDQCATLAGDLADSRQDARAAEVYEKVLKEGRDRVAVSNDMDWLAAHYLEARRPKDAERVARAAAEVGSAGGLELLGTVLEREGQLKEAEAVFRSLEERYNRRPLDLFYIRASRLPSGKAYEAPALRATKRIFPAGLERVRLADFSGFPTQGVTILQDTFGVRQLGLAKNDVLVALDGIRTRNLVQYLAVRALKQDQKIELIAWSQARRQYLTAEGRFVNRRFGSLLQDFGR